MTQTRTTFPGTSSRLHEPKFLGLLDRQLAPGESVVDTVDGEIEIFENGGLRPHHNLAIVLSDRRLFGLRGRGALGDKSPYIVDLKWVEEVAVTQQWNVSVKFKDGTGWPGWWKLHVGGNQQIADHWMSQIHTAVGRALGVVPQQPESGAGPSDDWQVMRRRLSAFSRALLPFTGLDSIGQPFGEGLGLETATQAMFESFDSVEQMRSAGETVAVTVLTDKRIGSDDLDYVMGSAALCDGVPAEQAKLALSLAGAAKSFLGEFDEPGAQMWELWKSRDDVAGEFLCWHCVAWERLAAIGKVEAL